MRRTHAFAFIGKAFAVSLALMPVSSADHRSYDGAGNNIGHSDWGSAGTRLQRLTVALYGDGISTLAEKGRPNPRAVSNSLCEQATIMGSNQHLSDMVWVWGQFLDHDISLTPEADEEFAPVMTEDSDELAPMIPMMRSTFDPTSGSDDNNPRQQINAITAFIDGSAVYGSDKATAMRLRTGENGELHITDQGMLPKNISGVEMANPIGLAPEELHSAGDVRANENPALLAMHTLWVREHNAQARQLANDHSEWTDEEIYQHARRIVSGEIQAITYEEFLPALLGNTAPSLDHAAYDPTLHPGILNEFSAGLYRLGHSMIPTHVAKIGPDGEMSDEPLLLLRDCFFNPQCLATQDSIDAIFRGLTSKQMQEIDLRVVDDLRNFLFGAPGSGGLDLISLNIQRGRDHGVADYNTVRESLGLSKVPALDAMSVDPAFVGHLNDLYGTTERIDLWIGAMSEKHIEGGSVGETVAAGLHEQFVRLRDGDRFFFLYDDDLTDDEKATIRKTRLSDVIVRNTGIQSLPVDVFHSQESMVADTDGDGSSDLHEAIAGTDAHDASSSFRLVGAHRFNETLELEWSSVPGKQYTVEYLSTLGGTWKALGSMEAAEAAPTTAFIDDDPQHTEEEQGYYRVSIRR